MASQLARGFLAEQDLERFVRKEHGGNPAAAARAKAASGEACMRNAPKAALKYFRDALDLATTEAARAAVHRSCAAACLEIGHFNRCAGHATRALVIDHDDKVALKHRLAAHEALGAWRRMNADALRIGDEDAAARAAADARPELRSSTQEWDRAAARHGVPRVVFFPRLGRSRRARSASCLSRLTSSNAGCDRAAARAASVTSPEPRFPRRMGQSRHGRGGSVPGEAWATARAAALAHFAKKNTAWERPVAARGVALAH